MHFLFSNKMYVLIWHNIVNYQGFCVLDSKHEYSISYEKQSKILLCVNHFIMKRIDFLQGDDDNSLWLIQKPRAIVDVVWDI